MNVSERVSVVMAAIGMLLSSSTGAPAVTIDLVTVGNPGNPDDTHGAGYGGVDYVYNIGKYEVTAGQYTDFLNAVAASDPYGLYNPTMGTHTYGCKIQRSGSPGSYTYSVAANRANRPANYVSFWDAARFANWMNNGQSSDPATIEDGAYTLNGYNGPDGSWIVRNAAALMSLTSEDEWYKAAYHKNDGLTGNYWDYPTGTNVLPSNDLVSPDPGNNANFYDGDYTIGDPYWTTEGGEFENSMSAYGTFDQGGNVWEWNEAVVFDTKRISRGGAFGIVGSALHASYRYYTDPTAEFSDRGFRMAAVPEPATLLLLILGIIVLGRRRRCHHRTV